MNDKPQRRGLSLIHILPARFTGAIVQQRAAARQQQIAVSYTHLELERQTEALKAQVDDLTARLAALENKIA